MNKHRERFNKLQGIKTQLDKDIRNLLARIKRDTKQLVLNEQAKEVIREVGIKTQEQLKFHLQDITSLAMESIFDDPYQLKVDFIRRRDKSECDLMFERNGDVMKPLDASGGGAVDIAAFALRIASWSMMNPRNNNVILLDEPFKYVSEDLRERASEMLKQVSEKLGIQFIIISHDTTLTSFADKIFTTKLINKITQVKSN